MRSLLQRSRLDSTALPPTRLPLSPPSQAVAHLLACVQAATASALSPVTRKPTLPTPVAAPTPIASAWLGCSHAPAEHSMHSSLKLHAQRAAAAARCRPALQQCLWGGASSSSSTSSSGNTSSSRLPFRQASDVRTMASKRAATATRPRKAPFIDEVQWQAPLEIIKYPDPRLRAVNANLSPAAFGDNLKALAEEMFKIMYTDDGVGLAAPQVGVNIRLMVFNETAQPGHEKETVLVNPDIVSTTAQTWLDEEGCLSFPEIRADVERHEGIRVRALDADGQPIQLELNGWEARIFQHEFDHLTGTLFHDRMKPSELEKVRPQLVAMEDAYLATHPGAEIQRVPPPKRPKVSKGFGSK